MEDMQLHDGLEVGESGRRPLSCLFIVEVITSSLGRIMYYVLVSVFAALFPPVQTISDVPGRGGQHSALLEALVASYF